MGAKSGKGSYSQSCKKDLNHKVMAAKGAMLTNISSSTPIQFPNPPLD